MINDHTSLMVSLLSEGAAGNTISTTVVSSGAVLGWGGEGGGGWQQHKG